MNDELIHYGVLGMKWGVRRTPEQLGHKKSKKSKEPGSKVKRMSDEELEETLKRLRKEDEYLRLTGQKVKTDPNQKSVGETIVQNTLKNVGTLALTSTIVGTTVAVGNQYLDNYNNMVGPHTKRQESIHNVMTEILKRFGR